MYEHYGVENLHFVQEDIGHLYGKGKNVPALKQIYQDLGYVTTLDDFNANESKYGNFGNW